MKKYLFFLFIIFISFITVQAFTTRIISFLYRNRNITFILNTEQFKYKYNTLEKYNIIYIDFLDTDIDTEKRKLKITDSDYITGIKISKYKHNITRAVITYKKLPEFSISKKYGKLKFSLNNNKPPAKVLKKIIIDPGHGGIDSGTSYKNLFEKDIVLKLALYLKKIITDKYGSVMSAELTRETDKYLTLPGRRKIAAVKEADIFISLHVDSMKNNKKASGSTVYFVDEEGATDRSAELLARKENIEDIINNQFDLIEEDDDLSFILLDIEKRDIINKSKLLAGIIEKKIRNSKLIRSRKVKRAPFAVLKNLRMPSVLIEMAFITNKKDRELIQSDKFLEKYAESVAEGIYSFLETK